jgi:hypothetical protein
MTVAAGDWALGKPSLVDGGSAGAVLVSSCITRSAVVAPMADTLGFLVHNLAERGRLLVLP